MHEDGWRDLHVHALIRTNYSAQLCHAVTTDPYGGSRPACGTHSVADRIQGCLTLC
jgi:hypothetical protein